MFSVNNVFRKNMGMTEQPDVLQIAILSKFAH